MAIIVPVIVPMTVAVGSFFLISMLLKREKWVCFWLFFTAFIQLFMEVRVSLIFFQQVSYGFLKFNYGVNHALVREQSTKYFHEFLLQECDVAGMIRFG